jgi:hypothetical protein
MNAASVQLFGAALDASDFARVMDKPEVVPGQKSCSRRSLRSPFERSRFAANAFACVMSAAVVGG